MKRKNLIRILSLLLALLMLLSGCDLYQGGETGDYLEDSQNVSDGAISGRRTGILRQGIPGQSKTFEVTEDWVYFPWIPIWVPSCIPWNMEPRC